MRLIFASGVGWSIIPDDVVFGTLKKLEYFDLQSNEIKKLPSSMGNLPHNCSIDIGGNPLESPPIKMADNYHNFMASATIVRFYAEEMCKQPGFTLQMMDKHIMECDVEDIDGLEEICHGMRNIIRSKKSLSAELRQECMERLAVVRNDKNTIKNLTHEGKTDLNLHAVCQSYYVTSEAIQLCLDEFGKEAASKINDNGLMPYDLLASNPCATDECKALLEPSDFSNIHQVGGLSDDPKNARDSLDYDIYAKAIVDVVDQVESGNKTNFSVGIFAPWGVGKSKLWELIKLEIKKNEDTKMAKWKKDMKASEERKGISQHDEGSASNSALYAAFSKCCNMIGRGMCQLHVSKTQEDAFNTDVEQGNKNEDEPESQPLVMEQDTSSIALKDSDEGKNDEIKKKESLAALMAGTWFLWGPILFLPIFLYKCVCRASGRPNNGESNDLGKDVLEILTGDYVPLHIHSSDVQFGLRPCVTTCIIMLFRMIPFTSTLALFENRSTCFIPPIKKTALVNKHIFIEFNAWVFNGSDVLWASLMESLWEAIEDQFGANTVRWHRASITLAGEKHGDRRPLEIRVKKRSLAIYKFYALSIFSTVLSIIGVIVGLYFLQVFSDDVQEVFNSTSTDINDGEPKDKATFNAILSIIGLQIPLFKMVMDFINKVLPELRNPRFKTLEQEEKNQRHDFSTNMGFMGKVRQEIEYLFDLLDCYKYFDSANNCYRPVRLSTFVDDLDRCDAPTVMKVLQAMKLLLDNVNNHVVTCYSAIDTRLVVASIEAVFKDVLKKAKVNGYNYLEKFIQVPFCIPTLSAEKKKEFLERLFLSWYLQNPSFLFDAIRKVKEKIVAYLNSHREWSTGKYHGDFVVLRDSEIPIFSKGKPFDNEGTNLLGFLKKVKDNGKSSKEVKKIFNDKIRYLLNYTGSEKENEEVLCLFSKYIQYFDHALSTLMKNSHQDLQIMPPAQQTAPPQPNKAANIEGIEEVNNQGEHDPAIMIEDLVSQPPEPQLLGPQPGIVGGVTVESFMQSMVDPDENAWFQRFSKYLEGKPRAMTRIVNIYNVARGIAKVKLGNDAMANTFRMKLIVMVFLVELWPYRMSWMFQIMENALEEEDLDSLVQHSNEERNRYIGKSMVEVIQQLFSNKRSEKMTHVFSRVSLFAVYQRVARVLMHSPKHSEDEMSRDSDPQMFEHLLLEKIGDSNVVMMMSDIIPVDYVENKQTLQPFIFNMQSHMIESVSKHMENIVLHVENGESVNDKDDCKSKMLQYEYVAQYFEKAKKTN